MRGILVFITSPVTSAEARTRGPLIVARSWGIMHVQGGGLSPRLGDAVPTDLAFLLTPSVSGSQNLLHVDNPSFRSLFPHVQLGRFVSQHTVDLGRICAGVCFSSVTVVGKTARAVRGAEAQRCRSIHEPGKPSPAKDSALSQPASASRPGHHETESTGNPMPI